jgi:hypothetical protein
MDSFETFLESWHGGDDSGTPKHIVDAHKAEAAKRGLTLKRTHYSDHLGITSKTHKGTLFSTDHDPKKNSFSHEEAPDN